MDRIAKLICVSSLNNNKFYDMSLVGDTIQVKYGRVGQTSASCSYPSYKWDSLYNSKIRKGYKDITELQAIEETSEIINISDSDINRIVNRLQAYANKTIRSNYTISSEAVTQKQIDRAQDIINKLISLKGNKDLFNNSLIELYTTIPRKMSNVNLYLIKDTQEEDRFINNEQSLLDTMAGQVNISKAKKDSNSSDKNILELLGIEIYSIKDQDKDIILSQLGEIKNRYKNAWIIKNLKTEDRFTKFVEEASNKTTRLFWHGSRNENWWNILNTGLLLRPSNVVISGKMYGYGTYFADKARKSLGYTSINGSYWARGNSSEAFMALFNVHLGNSLETLHRESWMGSLDLTSLRKRGDYDSVFAKGGADLINNEYIIYTENQATIRYLVELQ